MGLMDRVVSKLGNLCTSSTSDSGSRSIIVFDDATSNFALKYKLQNRIGRGSFGKIYQCKEISTGNKYACKLITKKVFKTQEDTEDVKREIGIMRFLPKNPNVIGFKDYFEDGKYIYIVMELCTGRDLFDYSQSKGRLDERETRDIMRSMSEAVKFCHDFGVMHRDLKPENFIFASKKEGAQLKLIDFGLSITFHPEQRFSEVSGSFSYIAPEVLTQSYGPEADIWSLGIIMYSLLSGRFPYFAVSGDLQFEAEPWPRISKYAKHLIQKMLEVNPSKRFTAQQILGHKWLKYMPGENEEDISTSRARRRNN